MTETQGVCPFCHQATTISFGYQHFTDELRWYVSSHCPHCHEYAEEVDGIDQLPEDLRKIDLQQNGEWSLKLISLGNQPGEGLKIIKDTLGLTYQSVSKLKNSLPAVIASGTKFEMEFYNSKLTLSYDELVTEIEAQL